jgi:hypothetical protein
MAPTREAWMTRSTLPRGSSYETMLEFFGIPPYTLQRLDENIAKKRRDWHHKSNSGNPVGRAKAKEVVALIQRAAQALKRGAPDNEGGGATADIPEAVFRTLAELWGIISAYVFADDYDGALRVAREAVSRWGMTPDAASVLAWVVATGFNTGNIAHPSLLEDGMRAADIAVREQPGEPRNWESRISLLIAGSRAQVAMAATAEAEQCLAGWMTARLHLLRARAAISLNLAEDAMIAAVRAVHTALPEADAATAIRSEATDLLVGWLGRNLLPLASAAALSRYVEMVNVAAWCSHGVPEAEDMVRVHRMWAANAGQRVFVGSWKLRSFLAVCTGFISLPIHNAVRSSPAWQVLFNGLRDESKRDVSFAIVAGPQYVQRAHNMTFAAGLDDI